MRDSAKVWLALQRSQQLTKNLLMVWAAMVRNDKEQEKIALENAICDVNAILKCLK